jgi:hypothetical protein
MEEIIKMDFNLMKFYKSDQGFAQYADRHPLLSSDQDIRRKHEQMLIDQALYKIERSMWEAEIKERAKAEGKAEAVAEYKLQIAENSVKSAESEGELPGIIKTLKRFRH